MDKVLKNYIKSFENLNENNISKLTKLCSEDVIFIDPFNKIKGKKNLEKMLMAMFQKTQNPSFKVIYSIGSSKQSIIKWNFSCRIFKKFIEFEGLSEIKIKKGLIIKHEDFWDSGSNFYANIPIVGRLFRNIKKN